MGVPVIRKDVKELSEFIESSRECRYGRSATRSDVPYEPKVGVGESP